MIRHYIGYDFKSKRGDFPFKHKRFCVKKKSVFNMYEKGLIFITGDENFYIIS